MRWLACVLTVVLVGACAGEVTEPERGAAPAADGDQVETTRPEPEDEDEDEDEDSDGDGDDRDAKERGEACPQVPAPEAEESAFEMVDVTEERGLVDPLLGMYGHAGAAADVNQDGWLDLFVGTFADRPTERYQPRGADGPSPDRLLLGGPDGFRVDPDFPGELARSSGAVFADLDGDGDPDLVVSRNTREGEDIDEGEDGPRRQAALEAETAIYRNDDGRFRLAGRPVPGLGARGVGVLDYDGDGLLDLFVAEDRWEGASSVLLRNTGDLEFSDVTADAGLPDDVEGLSVAAVDLTADGWSDLVVAGSNRLFVNTGEGSFREVEVPDLAVEVYGEEDFVAGVAVADLNRDGLPDLVLGQHYNSTVDFGCRVPVRVYLHRGVDGGDPTFEDVTERAGLVALPTKAPHVEVADFDNDGWPDILTSASAGDGSRPAILRHQGLDGDIPTFAGEEGLGDPRYWITGVSTDVDGDGRVDVFVVDHDPASASLLLRNETAGGRWLAVELDGGVEGLGSVVEVYRAGRSGDPDALLARQELTAGRGNAAGGPPVVHVGLGEEEVVDLVVRPPRAPVIERAGVDADQHLCLAERCAAPDR